MYSFIAVHPLAGESDPPLYPLTIIYHPHLVYPLPNSPHPPTTPPHTSLWRSWLEEGEDLGMETVEKLAILMLFNNNKKHQ